MNRNEKVTVIYAILMAIALAGGYLCRADAVVSAVFVFLGLIYGFTTVWMGYKVWRERA